MGILDLFRRPAPIADRAGLMDFVDAQAAFLGQKGVFEYSRAAAGPYGNILFNDKGFLAAVEVSRWQSYPLGLMMVGEMVEGELRRAAADRATQIREELAKIILGVFDRYATPPVVDAVAWQEARNEIDREFGAAALHPIRRIADIPARYAGRYVGVMPIHEKLRSKDTGTIHNYLKSNLINMHDIFVRRADLPALVARLATPVGS
ncbi:MAG: hypothetical protein AB7O50_02640 [Pseudolabrys sp.]